MQNAPAAVVVRLAKLYLKDKPLQSCLKSRFALIALCLLTVACSSSKPEFELVKPQYDLEYVSAEQELISAVNSASSRFSLDSIDDIEAWTRANMFFKEYTDSYSKSPDKLASAPGQKNRYRYEVIKSFDRSAGQVRYAVRCGPPGGNSALNPKAIQNAKNVARFIKDGNLELSILDR